MPFTLSYSIFSPAVIREAVYLEIYSFNQSLHYRQDDLAAVQLIMINVNC